MYLQLAEDNVKRAIADFYIPYPDNQGNPKLVREDLLDDLSDEDFDTYLDSLEEAGVNMGSPAKKAARQQRRADRKANKTAKKQQKTEKKAAKNAIKLAKAEGIKAGTWTGGGAGILDTVGDIAGNIFGGGSDSTAKDLSLTYSDAPGGTEEKKPPYLIYGLGAAALILTVFLMTRKRK